MTQNIIVSTRSTAIIAAQMCKKMGINSITIEILEEFESSCMLPSQKIQEDPNGWQQTVQSTQSKPDLTPILKCLHIVDHRIYPAIKARLKNWYLYDGLGHEVIDYMFRYVMSMI